MSLHNPFPKRGRAAPIEVFMFFWFPVILIGLPLLLVIIMGIWSGVVALLEG